MNILFRCVKKNLKRAKDGFSNSDRDMETSWFGHGHLRTAVERAKCSKLGYRYLFSLSSFSEMNVDRTN